MPAQAHGEGAIAIVGEVVEEMLVPAPRTVPRAVDEQQRCRVRSGAAASVDDFEHRCVLSVRSTQDLVAWCWRFRLSRWS